MSKQNIFENQQLYPEDLPSTSTIQFLPVEKEYLYILWIYRCIFFGILLFVSIIAYFFIGRLPFPYYIIPGGIVLLFVLSLILTRIAFRHKGYAVRQRDIIYKSGWLNRRMTTVPFSRVQHVDVHQNILERGFNLSTLNVYTAGGQASDLSIPGLLPDTSEKLKTFLLQTVSEDEEE